MLVLVLPVPATFLCCFRGTLDGLSDRALVLGAPPFASLLDFLHNPVRDHASSSLGLGGAVGPTVSFASAMLFRFSRRALRRESGDSLILRFPPHAQHLGLPGAIRRHPGRAAASASPGSSAASGTLERFAQFALFFAGPAQSELLDLASRGLLGSA